VRRVWEEVGSVFFWRDVFFESLSFFLFFLFFFPPPNPKNPPPPPKKKKSYIEKYVAADAEPQALREHPATALAPLVHVALALSDVAKLTGRKEPTVIT